jgi:signal transduction histidine kinase
MDNQEQNHPAPPVDLVARTLRHEVGDLLQTVYAVVALLQERLPVEWSLERRLLTDLRSRAETCKYELDAIHDLACPITLERAPVDLADLVGRLAAPAALRFPAVQLRVEATGPLRVLGDGRRLSLVCTMLLLNACQSARGEVLVAASLNGGFAVWEVNDDGPGATPEQLAWLGRPFPSTQQAQLGLGLALARRLAELHGGRVEAGNRPEGGFRVALHLPLQQEESPPPA